MTIQFLLQSCTIGASWALDTLNTIEIPLHKTVLISVVCLATILSFASYQSLNWLFCLYISYYSISFRVKQLSIFLQTNEKLQTNQEKSSGYSVDQDGKAMLPSVNRFNKG